MSAGSCIPSTICKYKNGTLKVATNAFNIGEVWNPVCCHDNETVRLVLWSTFSTILLQRIKHFWNKFAEMSFFVIFDQNLVESIWRHHLASLHILKIWISLERKEIFGNSKRHFSSTTCLYFKMASIGMMQFSSQRNYEFPCNPFFFSLNTLSERVGICQRIIINYF